MWNNPLKYIDQTGFIPLVAGRVTNTTPIVVYNSGSSYGGSHSKTQGVFGDPSTSNSYCGSCSEDGSSHETERIDRFTSVGKAYQSVQQHSNNSDKSEMQESLYSESEQNLGRI